LEAKTGSITGIIGANGAGKTTLVNIIAGILRPLEGRIFFRGKDITDLPAFERVKEGISLVPEGGRIFPTLTVLENLKAGCLNRAQKDAKANLDKVYSLFPILREREKQLASTLSGGEQRMLAIARALMSDPSLLIMDEPFTGIQPSIVLKLSRSLREMCDKGDVAILLVEQNLSIALNIMDRGYVFENGRIVLEGSSSELKNNEYIRRAYLGL
jgi:branched-chain amino acid transport system ATP-binding protein